MGTASKAPTRWSRGARCALRACGPAVLASPVFLQRVAPFSPARPRLPDQPTRVGLKGAGVSANPADVSTTANAVSEERSESREFCELGGIYDPAGSRP
ncbi:hypothetical protein [Halonotius roseus]|uniref:Uncharacterized protein n=1 Tax=Halonotius roseus TaxID=2511997 RepID=A0A544QN01_9EURY|nr:hypothetical protein [Halonotius roseus]TQQ80293.1 hypothetical protein EWF95_07290 [Halonotius roseus]